MASERNKKLSKAQVALLKALAAGTRNLSPGGYSTAGRDARAWWQTSDVLVRRGLAVRASRDGGGWLSLTDAGRALVGSLS